MSRRRRNNPPEKPSAPPQAAEQSETTYVNAALLERLEALEKAVEADAVGPIAAFNRQVLAEQARTTRPAGPGPVSHCPYCGTGDSPTGWRLADNSRGGWACTTCADIARPPFVDGRRTVPHAHEAAGLLASAYLGTPPIGWLVRFGARYGLEWGYATGPGAAPWSHVSDLDRWREVAALAVDRQRVGMDHRPPVDWDAHFNRPAPELALVHVPDWETGASSPRYVEVPPAAPEPEALERAAREKLSAEAKTVANLLKDRQRAEKEAAAREAEEAGRAARVEEIAKHYREHLQQIDQEAAYKREALRDAQRFALEREGLL